MFTDFIFNHSIGLNKLMEDLEAMNYGARKGQTFPPHRITKEGNKYYLKMTVAGYEKKDIKVELKDSETLSISSDGSSFKNIGDNAEELYDGIAARGFSKDFKLSPYMEVTNVTLENGILEVQLAYELPEEKKSKLLTIN